jgi:hypothetical protein
LAIPPNDFDLQFCGGAPGRKRTLRLITGEIAPAANHFLHLLHRAATNFDSGANACAVRRPALQLDGEARGVSFIAKNCRHFPQIVDDHVHVAIVVEIG